MRTYALGIIMSLATPLALALDGGPTIEGQRFLIDQGVIKVDQPRSQQLDELFKKTTKANEEAPSHKWKKRIIRYSVDAIDDTIGKLGPKGILASKVYEAAADAAGDYLTGLEKEAQQRIDREHAQGFDDAMAIFKSADLPTVVAFNQTNSQNQIDTLYAISKKNLSYSEAQIKMLQHASLERERQLRATNIVAGKVDKNKNMLLAIGLLTTQNNSILKKHAREFEKVSGGVSLFMESEFNKLSLAQKAAWLDAGFKGHKLSEEEEEKTKLAGRFQETALKIIFPAERISGLLTSMQRLNLGPDFDKLVQIGQTAVAASKGATTIVTSVMMNKPLDMISGTSQLINALFSNPDPAAERHAQVMKLLGHIIGNQKEISEQVGQIAQNQQAIYDRIVSLEGLLLEHNMIVTGWLKTIDRKVDIAINKIDENEWNLSETCTHGNDTMGYSSDQIQHYFQNRRNEVNKAQQCLDSLTGVIGDSFEDKISMSINKPLFTQTASVETIVGYKPLEEKRQPKPWSKLWQQTVNYFKQTKYNRFPVSPLEDKTNLIEWLNPQQERLSPDLADRNDVETRDSVWNHSNTYFQISNFPQESWVKFLDVGVINKIVDALLKIEPFMYAQHLVSNPPTDKGFWNFDWFSNDSDINYKPVADIYQTYLENTLVLVDWAIAQQNLAVGHQLLPFMCYDLIRSSTQDQRHDHRIEQICQLDPSYEFGAGYSMERLDTLYQIINSNPALANNLFVYTLSQDLAFRFQNWHSYYLQITASLRRALDNQEATGGLKVKSLTDQFYKMFHHHGPIHQAWTLEYSKSNKLICINEAYEEEPNKQKELSKYFDSVKAYSNDIQARNKNKESSELHSRNYLLHKVVSAQIGFCGTGYYPVTKPKGLSVRFAKRYMPLLSPDELLFSRLENTSALNSLIDSRQKLEEKLGEAKLFPQLSNDEQKQWLNLINYKEPRNE